MLYESTFISPPTPLNEIITGAATQTSMPQSLSVSPKKWCDTFECHDNFEQNAGIYIFWWKGKNPADLVQTTEHWVKGKRASADDPCVDGVTAKHFPHKKAGSNEDTAVDYLHYRGRWEFISQEINGETYYPLYVGKSTNVFKRIKQHLSWPSTYADEYADHLANHLHDDLHLIPRYGTASQLSDHYYFLFRNLKGGNRGHAEKINNLCLSVAFTPFTDYANRFFNEDLLIGELRPPFNLDSER
jgi:hypothetical protein